MDGGPQRRVESGVTAQRRHRSVDEAGVRHFVGVRLTVTSPESLLYAPERLVEVVRVAKQSAAEARASGRWDTVDEIELVTGNDALRMSTAEFAQYVDDLRTRRPHTLR